MDLQNDVPEIGPRLESIAGLVLDEARAAGADEAECSVVRSVQSELYYESGKISMLRTGWRDQLSIKVLRDKRKGSVSGNDCSPEAIRVAVGQAVSAAAAAERDEAEGIAERIRNGRFARGPAEPDRDRMYEQLSGLIEDCRQDWPLLRFDNAGVHHACSDRLYANSNGVSLAERNGAYRFDSLFMAVDGERTSSFQSIDLSYTRQDQALAADPNIARALGEASRQIETRTLDGSFIGDLIITPSALASFLWATISCFAGGHALISGTSPWKGLLGTQVATDDLTLRLDPRDPELPTGRAVTADGYVSAPHTVIRDGVLEAFVLDRYSAAKTGEKRSPTWALDFVVEPGRVALDDLIGDTRCGILLNRLSGGKPSPNGDINGVAKNSFLVENGQIGDPVREVMISANLAKMLQNIIGISRERACDGQTRLPWLRTGGVTISGK